MRYTAISWFISASGKRSFVFSNPNNFMAGSASVTHCCIQPTILQRTTRATSTDTQRARTRGTRNATPGRIHRVQCRLLNQIERNPLQFGFVFLQFLGRTCVESFQVISSDCSTDSWSQQMGGTPVTTSVSNGIKSILFSQISNTFFCPKGQLLWTPQSSSRPIQTQPLSPYHLSQLRKASHTSSVLYPTPMTSGPQHFHHPFGAS